MMGFSGQHGQTRICHNVLCNARRASGWQDPTDSHHPRAVLVNRSESWDETSRTRHVCSYGLHIGDSEVRQGFLHMSAFARILR